MPPETPGPGPTRVLRIAMAADAPVVVAGIQAMLRAAGPDIASAGVWDPARAAAADVVLYDPLRGSPTLPQHDPRPRLVAFSWQVSDDVATRARAQGASALLSKELTAPRLLAALRSIHSGQRTGFLVTDVAPEAPDKVVTAPLKRPDGLTAREAEMLELITQGLSNDEIARTLYLSINSVKTYIRTAYRKIGVTRRPQAVLWGIQHGYGDELRKGLPG